MGEGKVDKKSHISHCKSRGKRFHLARSQDLVVGWSNDHPYRGLHTRQEERLDDWGTQRCTHKFMFLFFGSIEMMERFVSQDAFLCLSLDLLTEVQNCRDSWPQNKLTKTRDKGWRQKREILSTLTHYEHVIWHDTSWEGSAIIVYSMKGNQKEWHPTQQQHLPN